MGVPCCEDGGIRLSWFVGPINETLAKNIRHYYVWEFVLGKKRCQKRERNRGAVFSGENGVLRVSLFTCFCGLPIKLVGWSV